MIDDEEQQLPRWLIAICYHLTIMLRQIAWFFLTFILAIIADGITGDMEPSVATLLWFIVIGMTLLVIATIGLLHENRKEP